MGPGLQPRTRTTRLESRSMRCKTADMTAAAARGGATTWTRKRRLADAGEEVGRGQQSPDEARAGGEEIACCAGAGPEVTWRRPGSVGGGGSAVQGARREASRGEVAFCWPRAISCHNRVISQQFVAFISVDERHFNLGSLVEYRAGRFGVRCGALNSWKEGLFSGNGDVCVFCVWGKKPVCFLW